MPQACKVFRVVKAKSLDDSGSFPYRTLALLKQGRWLAQLIETDAQWTLTESEGNATGCNLERRLLLDDAFARPAL